MSEKERERLKNKEQHRNPVTIFNYSLNHAITGNPSGSGCSLIVIIILIFVVFNACSF